MHHDLKSHPVFFQELQRGTQTADLRKNDRNFMIGDNVTFREYFEASGTYSGRTITAKIVGILPGERLKGLDPQWVMLSFERLHDEDTMPDVINIQVPARRQEQQVALPTGTVQKAKVLEVTAVSMTVESETGERHLITGKNRDVSAKVGDEGELTYRGGKDWSFLKTP